MVFLSYKESIDEEIMKLLKDMEIFSFSKWPQIHNSGKTGRPRFGTHIFPGYNSGIIFPIQEKKIDILIDRIEEFNRNVKFEGIKAYSWKLEKIVEK